MKKAVLFSMSVLGALIALRSLYTLTTGYILPDEAFYLNLMTLHGGLGFSVYRPILHLFYAIFFTGFGSLQGLVVRGALFCAVWAMGSVIALDRTLKALEISDRVTSLVIVSFVLMPVFPLMAVFFVTETMALFFGLLGIYFSVRYVKNGGWKPALSASLSFLFASQVREPYLLFLVATPAALFFLRKPSLKPAIGYGIPLLVGLPVPSSIHPLSIVQPVSAILFEWFPNYLLGVLRIGASHPSASALPSYVLAAANTVHVTISVPAFEAFAVGLAFGVGPVMAVLLLGSPFFARGKASLLVAAFALFAFTGYFVTTDFAVEYLPNALALWTSNIIRLSSAALPAGVALGYLYSKAGPRFAYVCILGTLVIGGATLPAFASAIQSSQNVANTTDPVNRLSLDYRAPYYRMYQILKPGDLVLTGSTGIVQLSVYASMVQNVTVVGFPADRTGFDSILSEKWNHVYLFDDWVSLQNKTFLGDGPGECQCYPGYLVGVLYSSNVTLLWSDVESYAEVVR